MKEADKHQSEESLTESMNTMHLSDAENALLKLAVFGLLHLSKCGAVSLGNDLKVAKSIFSYSSQTIKQKEKFIQIAEFQVKRIGGQDEFSKYLKKING